MYNWGVTGDVSYDIPLNPPSKGDVDSPSKGGLDSPPKGDLDPVAEGSASCV